MENTRQYLEQIVDILIEAAKELDEANMFMLCVDVMSACRSIFNRVEKE